MSTDLREELDALARTQSFSPDPSAWDRGRRARRRDRALAVVAALVMIAGFGGAALWSTSDRESRTATAPVVPGGAIPSRIDDPGELEPERDLAIGRGSVAFLSAADQAVVVGATDGRYRALSLPDGPEEGGLLSLSPDGWHLVWSNHGRIHEVDLEDGRETYYGSDAEHASVTALRWAPRSDMLIWDGTDERGRVTGGVLPVGDSPGDPLPPTALRGIPSPSGDLVAAWSDGTAGAAPFLRRRGKPIARELPADLYLDGASVSPLGWTATSLVLADVDAPAGSYVEGRHLTLFTSPDRPESEWTYRIVMRDVPAVANLSLAVDLVPDLDGTSSQELTHDFDAADGTPAPFGIELSLFIGLGVAAAIAVLLALQWLWRRLS